MTVSKITSPIDANAVIVKINEVIDNLGTIGSMTLSGLSDVNVSSVTNGQVLSYNGSSWVNSTPTTVTFRNWS